MAALKGWLLGVSLLRSSVRRIPLVVTIGVLAAAGRLAVAEEDSAFAQALAAGGSLKTAVVTAEEAAVRDGERAVATVGRGRILGVLASEEGRVRVRPFVGGEARPGWLDVRDVRLLADEDADVAGEALRMGAALNPEADLALCRMRLNALVDRLADAAGIDGTPRERVRRISVRLFGPEGYRYHKGVKRLDQALKRKAGDCVALSLIYLAVARRLRMPIHLVTWPAHVLVRYEDGPHRFNIETTANGELRSVDDPVQHRRGRVAGGIHCMALPHPRALGVVHHIWGAILWQRGLGEEACARFARAAEINPRDAEAHALWGATLHKLGRHEQACRRFADVVAIDPHHGEVNIRWGFALCRLERYGEASAKFERAAALAPDFADAWYGWGFALTKLGEHAAACEKLAKATALRRRFPAAYAVYGAALARLGRYQEADRKYAKAAIFQPSATTYAGWGFTLAQMGDHAGACEKYAKAVQLDATNAQSWNNWGWALTRLGRWAEACEKCEKAVALDPDRPASRHSYGVALTGLGKLDAACAQFARAVALDPGHALSHLDWAAALARKGKAAEARRKLARALALDPALEAEAERVRVHLHEAP